MPSASLAGKPASRPASKQACQPASQRAPSCHHFHTHKLQGDVSNMPAGRFAICIASWQAGQPAGRPASQPASTIVSPWQKIERKPNVLKLSAEGKCLEIVVEGKCLSTALPSASPAGKLASRPAGQPVSQPAGRPAGQPASQQPRVTTFTQKLQGHARDTPRGRPTPRRGDHAPILQQRPQEEDTHTACSTKTRQSTA